MENKQENKQKTKIYEDENYKNIFNNKKNFKDFLRDFTEIEVFKELDENEIKDQKDLLMCQNHRLNVMHLKW